MEIEEDLWIPIILGHPFLATAAAMIDAKIGGFPFKWESKNLS